MKPTFGSLDVKPDNRTVQACCLAYGGNSFAGPMKEALECHLGILKARHPEMNVALHLLNALKAIQSLLPEDTQNKVELLIVEAGGRK